MQECLLIDAEQNFYLGSLLHSNLMDGAFVEFHAENPLFDFAMLEGCCIQIMYDKIFLANVCYHTEKTENCTMSRVDSLDVNPDSITVLSDYRNLTPNIVFKTIVIFLLDLLHTLMENEGCFGIKIHIENMDPHLMITFEDEEYINNNEVVYRAHAYTHIPFSKLKPEVDEEEEIKGGEDDNEWIKLKIQERVSQLFFIEIQWGKDAIDLIQSSLILL